MLRTLTAALIASIVGTASAVTDVAAQTVHTYTGGGAYNYGTGPRGSVLGPSSHLGTGIHSGTGYAGRRLGGHTGSGWYHRGFGGTLNPGWDYGFGKSPGSLGR